MSDVTKAGRDEITLVWGLQIDAEIVQVEGDVEVAEVDGWGWEVDGQGIAETERDCFPGRGIKEEIVSSVSSSESSKAVISAAARFRTGLEVWRRAGADRMLEHLCDLKQVAWTVALQRKQGTGLELPWNIFLQSSQQG